MIKSSYPHLFFLAIAFLISLLFTIGNCNNNYNNQMETILFEKRLLTTDHLNHFLQQEKFNNNNNNNNDDDDDLRISIRDLLKPYPNRRSSFHAMRGKRQIISP